MWSVAVLVPAFISHRPPHLYICISVYIYICIKAVSGAIGRAGSVQTFRHMALAAMHTTTQEMLYVWAKGDRRELYSHQF
jgi:hypothetical protein